MSGQREGVHRTDEKAFRLIRRFMQAPADETEIGEILDAIGDVIKSTGRLHD
jgi:hypothetical protein